MRSFRWALTLVITMMLIDSWNERAEARSTELSTIVVSSWHPR
jgi:hypothetical protein